MRYYNIKVYVLLKKNLEYVSGYQKIFDLVAKAMLKDEKLKVLHEKNEYKNYVFSNLYPVEQEHLYKQGNVYQFDLRGIDFKNIIKLKQLIGIVETDYLRVVQVEFQTSEQRNIKKLISLTPAVITTDKGDYDIKNDMELVKKRILANTQKKYKAIYGTSINVDFINGIKKTNRIPDKIPFKNINFLGNKFEIEIKQDPISQELAYTVLSIGLLEKNSLGMGFCRAQ